MEDFIGKIVVIVLGVWLLFYLPVLVVSQKQDTAIQSYVDGHVEEFVNASIETGYISTQNYLKMMNALDNTGLIYDVSMTYSKRKVYPVFDETTGEPTGEYEVHYTDYVRDEIEDVIFPASKSAYSVNEKFYMNNGDHFQVAIHNASPTFGSRMMQILTTRDNFKTIISSYGGYVGNTAQ